LGYAGSEEFIRLQFEEYLLALLSAVKFKIYTENKREDPKQVIVDVGKVIWNGHVFKTHHADEFVEGDPASDFGNDWVKAWMQTENFRIFNKFTGKKCCLLGRFLALMVLDSHIFDIVDPNHPCTGGLTIEDVQRRLAQ
jgi:hypothetical protein